MILSGKEIDARRDKWDPTAYSLPVCNSQSLVSKIKAGQDKPKYRTLKPEH